MTKDPHVVLTKALVLAPLRSWMVMATPPKALIALYPLYAGTNAAVTDAAHLASIFHEGWLVNGPASLPVSCS